MNRSSIALLAALVSSLASASVTHAQSAGLRVIFVANSGHEASCAYAWTPRPGDAPITLRVERVAGAAGGAPSFAVVTSAPIQDLAAPWQLGPETFRVSVRPLEDGSLLVYEDTVSSPAAATVLAFGPRGLVVRRAFRGARMPSWVAQRANDAMPAHDAGRATCTPSTQAGHAAVDLERHPMATLFARERVVAGRLEVSCSLAREGAPLPATYDRALTTSLERIVASTADAIPLRATDVLAIARACAGRSPHAFSAEISDRRAEDADPVHLGIDVVSLHGAPHLLIDYVMGLGLHRDIYRLEGAALTEVCADFVPDAAAVCGGEAGAYAGRPDGRTCSMVASLTRDEQRLVCAAE